MTINEYLKEIDEIDKGIIKSFSERLRILEELVRLKAKKGTAVVDAERENEKMAGILDHTEADFRAYIGNLYSRVFELDRLYQERILRESGEWAPAPAPTPTSATSAAGSPGVSRHEHVDAAKRKMTNIALIGMPGCGKTSIGRCLAGIIGCDFFDTYELIETKAGKSVERIIRDGGENTLRDMETKVLKEVLKKNGCVIATSGGVVKRGENKGLLQENSTVVFLDRTPAELLSDGGALSNLQSIKTIYLEQLPLYLEWCDIEVATSGGVERTAHAVKNML